MSFFQRFIENHVLANMTFVLVLVVGAIYYGMLPREQDPTINFNWIQITTLLPGASAEDVEKRITDPIEDVLRNVSDIRFVSSTSRESVSSILVRFNDLSQRVFDKRVTDLRREIQNKQDELPADIEDPDIMEITTANGFPTATVIVTSPADDENLRRVAERTRKDLERLKGVDKAMPTGLLDPELQVLFDASKLSGLGVAPSHLADTVRAYFRDTPAGTQKVGAEEWLIRLVGTNADPEYLAQLPITTAQGRVRLGDVAQVQRGREKANRLVSFNGKPSIMLAVTKKEGTNTIELVERIKAFVSSANMRSDQTGVSLMLADDQTETTRSAIRIMQNNAIVGLILVLLVSWAFLGLRIAGLVSIGIPFILCGTFWALAMLGHTLNVMVLLGVVIALGMLVDDAVVVVENIYHRINRGEERMQAIRNALHEVVPPVTTSVLTTMAAFLPLLLMPGIVGKFMGVVPVVVSVALVLSLIESYWMLPAHVLGLKQVNSHSRLHVWRRNFNHRLRITYTRMLVKAMRHRVVTLSIIAVMFLSAIVALLSGAIRVDFFASDPLRIFYVSLEMPKGTDIRDTLHKAEELEGVARAHLLPGEARAVVSYSGQLFTEIEPLYGDQYGQVLVSLNPKKNGMRGVHEIIESMRNDIMAVTGTANISFLRIEGGPPTTKPINIKVRGDDFGEIRSAVAALKHRLSQMPGVKDISDDSVPGRSELALSYDLQSIKSSGVDPTQLTRDLRLLVDGEVVTSMQDRGEELEVRVRAMPRDLADLDEVLQAKIPAQDGRLVPLSELVKVERRQGMGNIRHYNYRRSISVEADLDQEIIDTVAANQQVVSAWQDELSLHYPNIDLDFSGELDDIEESLDAMRVLFIFGVLLIYLIIGTQFRSYFQPLLILSTIPMAFTGVVFGLIITGNPLSLFTLYGVVALTGIAVNASIVLISAANNRLQEGMNLTYAVLFAAKRRVVPITITTLTTMAGLFSLATGLGGKSLIWGPVAIAIVFGLAFSSLLTLFAVPVLYRIFVRPKQ
ncbi:MAG: efflux RND transporter permease subunit [Acidobacteria bacterium]|nr:efflux RND transporter permease subunit [Acidobacteriota bacterium]